MTLRIKVYFGIRKIAQSLDKLNNRKICALRKRHFFKAMPVQ